MEPDGTDNINYPSWILSLFPSLNPTPIGLVIGVTGVTNGHELQHTINSGISRHGGYIS